jgi:hypothetical protein
MWAAINKSFECRLRDFGDCAELTRSIFGIRHVHMGSVERPSNVLDAMNEQSIAALLRMPVSPRFPYSDGGFEASNALNQK